MDIYKHFAFQKKKRYSRKSLAFHAGKVVKARNDISNKGQKLKEKIIAICSVARGCNMWLASIISLIK